MKALDLIVMLVIVAGWLTACGDGLSLVPARQGIPPAADGTLLRKIQARGKLIVGVKYDVPMFGLFDPKTNQVEGFDVDVAREIAQYIFGAANVVEFKEVLPKDRISSLQDGTLDLVVSTMTINAEREQQIDFSVVYYVAGQSLLVPRNSRIASIQDLANKKVGTARGSTSEQNIRVAAPQVGVQLFDSYSAAVAAMDAGQLDAVTTDDNILIGFQAREPNKWKLVGGTFTQEPYGVGIAKGHPELVEIVNRVIRDLKTSGRWKDIYKKNIPTEPPEPPIDDWRKIVGQ